MIPHEREGKPLADCAEESHSDEQQSIGRRCGRSCGGKTTFNILAKNDESKDKLSQDNK